MTNEKYYFIAYELLAHKVECKYRYEEDCETLGEDHEITKHREQLLKDAEKAIELFMNLMDQEAHT